MKKLLLSTAIIAAAAGTAWAQTAANDLFRTEMTQGDVLASDLIGARIYASETEVAGDAANGVQEGWEDIGEVNDVILSPDGNVQAVLVDIGGFLGMGERQVAVQMPALRVMRDDATDADDFFLVMTANRGLLEEAPAYGMPGDGAQADPNQTGVTAGDTATASGTTNEPTTSTGGLSQSQQEATAEGGLSDDQPPVQAEDPTMSDQAASNQAATGTAAEDAAGGTSEMVGEVIDQGQATPDAVEGAAPGTRDGYASATPEMLTAENLTSAEVYDARDERIGEIADLILDDQGKITEVVLDVGGFLGIGEKRVALPMSEVEIMRADSNGALRVYVPHSEEQLEQMPTAEVEG